MYVGQSFSTNVLRIIVDPGPRSTYSQVPDRQVSPNKRVGRIDFPNSQKCEYSGEKSETCKRVLMLIYLEPMIKIKEAGMEAKYATGYLVAKWIK